MRFWDTSALVPLLIDEDATSAMRARLGEDPDVVVWMLTSVELLSTIGRLGRTKLAGVHVQEADEIAIEGEASQVILDGETFRACVGKPILLRPARPLSFARIAA